MTQSSSDQSTPSQLNRPWSAALFRWAGYGLLVLALLDLIEILIPPQLTNPTWEFQTIGSIVERIPVPLLGLVLIFYGEAAFRGKFEQFIVKILSWLSLVFGIFLLLLVPLGISDTVRINNQNTSQLSAQYNQQVSRVEQLEEQLNQATPQQLNNFLQRRGVSENQLFSQIEEAKQAARSQYEQTKAQQRRSLLENSFKWNIGALISGALFVYIWRLTPWARRAKSGSERTRKKPFMSWFKKRQKKRNR